MNGKSGKVKKLSAVPYKIESPLFGDREIPAMATLNDSPVLHDDLGKVGYKSRHASESGTHDPHAGNSAWNREKVHSPISESIAAIVESLEATVASENCVPECPVVARDGDKTVSLKEKAFACIASSKN